MTGLHFVWNLAQAILTSTFVGARIPIDVADLVLTGWNIEPCEREDADPSEWSLRVHFAPRKGSGASEAIQAGSVVTDFDLGDDPTAALDELIRIAMEEAR